MQRGESSKIGRADGDRMRLIQLNRELKAKLDEIKIIRFKISKIVNR